MKKAEIILSVTKQENNISEIKCDMSRGIDFDPLWIIVRDGIPKMIDDKVYQNKASFFYEVDKDLF